VTDREYVPPFEPLAPVAVEALSVFLDGQSLIRGAYLDGVRSGSGMRARAAERTEDVLWFDVGGRRRSAVAGRALRAGVSPQVHRALTAVAPGAVRSRSACQRYGWNFVGRRTILEAGEAVAVVWRVPQEARPGLDVLDFDLKWRPLEPPRVFAAEARALLESCVGIQRAWLAEEVPLKKRTRDRRARGALLRRRRSSMAETDRRRSHGARDARVAQVRRRPGGRLVAAKDDRQRALRRVPYGS